MHKVIIRPGVFSYIISPILIIIGVYIVSFGIRIFYRLFFTPLLPKTTLKDVTFTFTIGLGITLLGLFFVYFALSLLVQKYIISLEGVEIHRFRKTKVYQWKDVIAIAEIPAPYSPFGNNYVVGVHYEKRGTMLLISWVDKPKLAAMALFEAAYLSGNNIQFNFFAGNEFGPPPYGIFLDLPES